MVDAFGVINSGKWAEETNQTWAVDINLAGTTVEPTFVGMQRGRWRVRAEIDGQSSSWSRWRYSKYTV